MDSHWLKIFCLYNDKLVCLKFDFIVKYCILCWYKPIIALTYEDYPLFCSNTFVHNRCVAPFPDFQNAVRSHCCTMLLFAIAYLTIAILLLLRAKIAYWLGIIVPLAGLAIGFFKVGIQNWDGTLTFMFVTDAIVLVCCVALLYRYNRK